MQAYRWPGINVESMKAMKRGRDKRNKPPEERYTIPAAQAATQMPCGHQIFARDRNESKSRAEANAKVAVQNQGAVHIKKCAKCKATQ